MLTLRRSGTYGCISQTFSFDTTNLGVSDFILIPADMLATSVQLVVLNSASVTLDATVSTDEEIIAGTAYWKEWDTGALTNGAMGQDAFKGPVGAIRLRVKTALAGENAKLSIRAYRGAM